MDTILDLNPFGTIKKVYPYRTARVFDWSLKVSLTNEDMRMIGEELGRAGFEMDNHIVIVFENEGVETNMWLHDGKLLIGGKIDEGGY